jgi:hypothetical protein
MQDQFQPLNEICKVMELELSLSPQTTILRRMKEETRNDEGEKEGEYSCSSQENDERIIQLEKEAVARELDYLLNDEVPPALAELLSVLTGGTEHLECNVEEETRRAEALSMAEQEDRLRRKVALDLDSILKYGSGQKEKKSKHDSGEAEDENTKASKRGHMFDFNKKTDEGHGSLRGFAAISGWKIYKSELRLEVKPIRGKKVPLSLKTQVSHLSPLRVAQIHNARNHMMAAIGELKRLQRLINNNRGKANENGLTEALRRIKDELRMAREELVINEAHQFPDNLFTPNGFLPPLPPEIAVEFSIFNSQLILSVYILHSSALTVKPNLPVSLASGKTSLVGDPLARPPKSYSRRIPSIGQSYVAQGKKIEIVDMVRIACDIPSLKSAVKALEQADDLANELGDKLLALTT